MSKLKDKYEISLRCATCGCDDQFEANEDRSYINWRILDGKSSVATDDFSDSDSVDAKQALLNSSVITDELQQIVNHVDIAHSMAVRKTEHSHPILDS
jgi:hypothetical protein